MNNLRTCAICCESIKEALGIEQSQISTFLARKVRTEATIVKLRCNHEFHHACISKWVKKKPTCPLDRRLIVETTPALSISVNLRKELLNSIKQNQIENVQYILSTGLNPNQRSLLNRKNPLAIALKKRHWEISAKLICAGATSNNKIAQNNLGWMYQKGLGVEQNYPEALSWYRKAAAQGYAIAQCNLGLMHLKGLGVEQNYSEALYWYRKAAAQGHASGQNGLGWMYLKGLGVKQNYPEALSLYRKAAAQGDAIAQSNLAFLKE